MPYNVTGNSKTGFKVVKEGGKVVAGNKTKLSKEQAMAAMHARYAAESGMPMHNK